MKRKISLVIAFALSFLLMFSPIAKAEETTIQTFTTSEPIELKVVEIPQYTNSSDSPPQEKFQVPVLDEEPTTSSRGGCVPCPNNIGMGHWTTTFNGMHFCIRDCN